MHLSQRVVLTLFNVIFYRLGRGTRKAAPLGGGRHQDPCSRYIHQKLAEPCLLRPHLLIQFPAIQSHKQNQTHTAAQLGVSLTH